MALRTQLETEGAWCQPITSYDPDTVHAEPGYPVAVSFLIGLEIGRAFRQGAIFVVEEDRLTVMTCKEDQRRLVSAFRERVDPN